MSELIPISVECVTPGCANQGVEIEVMAHSTNTRVECGPCGAVLIDGSGLGEADVEQLRLSAIQNEAMPLYLLWQSGLGTEQAWLDKMAEIEERFAPEEPEEPEEE